MILCLGTTPTVQRSMTFDRVAIDDVNRAIEVKDYASGKSPNVARILRTLGADPLAVGFAGGDRGRFLLDDMAKAGIRHDFVMIPEPTRLCTTVIDQSNSTATELVEEHAVVSSSAWAEMDRKLLALAPRSKLWIFSGSLPPGAPQDFYARYVPLARANGARLILDTRGQPLKLSLIHDHFIVKLNRDELAATLDLALDSETAITQAARRVCPAGGAAIVTLGAGGALACAGNRAWRVTAPKVRAISPIGSGDAFAAGLGWGLLQEMSMPEALGVGCACGSANAMTALAGHMSPSDFEALRRKVDVTDIP
ncbi:MAG TPA: hexose kinase [Tepidisphaeraceae bacterium]|jgi:tagatose 6-phosphate kinase|nr:hexose kinase [Tepidisphaeraceae bacterium]